MEHLPPSQNIWIRLCIDTQNLQHHCISYNQNEGSECIFTINKEQSLDEPSEIAEDQLDPTTNSYTHSKINKFSEETSKKKVTENATLIKAKEENDQQKIMGSKADDNGSKHNSRKKPDSR